MYLLWLYPLGFILLVIFAEVLLARCAGRSIREGARLTVINLAAIALILAGHVWSRQLRNWLGLEEPVWNHLMLSIWAAAFIAWITRRILWRKSGKETSR